MMKDKLKSDSGATILIALLFFLMCAIAGAVILTAATAASGRVSGLKSQEQTYDTLRSAAELLRAEIEGQNCSVFLEYEDAEGTAPVMAEGKQALGYNQEPQGSLAAELKSSMEAVLLSTEAVPVYTDRLTVQAKDPDSLMKDVEATWSMDAAYTITIVCRMKDAEDVKSKASYTLTVPAAVSRDQVPAQAVRDGQSYWRRTTTLTWTDAVIRKS